MLVKEFIKILQEFDQELEIVVSDDGMISYPEALQRQVGFDAAGNAKLKVFIL